MQGQWPSHLSCLARAEQEVGIAFLGFRAFDVTVGHPVEQFGHRRWFSLLADRLSKARMQPQFSAEQYPSGGRIRTGDLICL